MVGAFERKRRRVLLRLSQIREASGPSKRDGVYWRGYKGWKRAVGDQNKGLELHNACPTHVRAMEDWAEAKLREESDSNVSSMVSSNVLEKNRYYSTYGVWRR